MERGSEKIKTWINKQIRGKKLRATGQTLFLHTENETYRPRKEENSVKM